MRLSPEQIELIRSALYRRFGGGTRVWLFGSRLDDDALGGDIDLNVEPERVPPGNPFLIRQETEREPERGLRVAVDLVVNSGRTSAFMESAKAEGMPL